MPKLKYFSILIALLLLYPSLSIHAQQNEAIVYGVFFYSPTCPHCHEVINNHWDDIQSEFGEQLQVLFVNVQTSEGSQLMQTARSAMSIEANGVPMLIIGDTVLFGSYDIPALAPVLIRDGLASGGINVPPVPGVEELFIAVLGDDYIVNDYRQITEPESIMSDPANILAIGILFALIASLVMMIGAGFNPKMRQMVASKMGYAALIIITFSGIALSALLLVGSENGWVSGTILIIMLSFVGMLIMLVKQWSQTHFPRAMIPLLLLVGTMIAGYMSYVESTASEAVCGLLGHCNVVQQSDYAQILGVPVGVIGIAGYVVLFLVWLINQGNRQGYVLMLLLVSVGVVFSIYLTYLEPFVIGASCMWCLTSALTMMALLWVVTPEALETLHQTTRSPELQVVR